MPRTPPTRCLRTALVYGRCLKCFQPVEEAHLMDPDETPLWILCGNCCPEHAVEPTKIEHKLVTA